MECKVEHSRFGIGEVINISGEGNNKSNVFNSMIMEKNNFY